MKFQILFAAVIWALLLVGGGAGYWYYHRQTACERLESRCRQAQETMDVRGMGLCSYGLFWMGKPSEAKCSKLLDRLD